MSPAASTRVRPALCAGVLLCLLAAPRLQAQEAPRPKPDSSEMTNALEAMMPMFGQMMAGMMNGVLEILARPESAEKLATFSRQYFDALMRRGFTREEALHLVAAVGFPSLGGMR